ncbi:hypothetical protein RCL1_006452 [Eukaryota sp. TZLM3-RCL]
MHRFSRLSSVFSSVKSDPDGLLFVSSPTAIWDNRKVPLSILVYEDGFSVCDLSNPSPHPIYSAYTEDVILAVTPLHSPPQPIRTSDLPSQNFKPDSRLKFDHPAVLVAALKGSNILLEVHSICSSSAPLLIPSSVFQAPQPETYTDIQLFSSRHAVVFCFSHHLTIFCPSTLTPLKQLSLSGLPLSFSGRWLSISSTFSDDQSRSCSHVTPSIPMFHYVVSTTHSVVKTLGNKAQGLAGSMEPPTELSESHGSFGVVLIDVISSCYSSSSSPHVVSSFISHSRPVVSACFCSRGVKMVMSDDKCRVLSLVKLSPNCELDSSLIRGATNARPVSISFSADNRWVAVLTSHGTAHLFSTFQRSKSHQTESSLRLKHGRVVKNEEEKGIEHSKSFIAFVSDEIPRSYSLIVFVGGTLTVHSLSEQNLPNNSIGLKVNQSNLIELSCRPRQGERKTWKRQLNSEGINDFDLIEVLTCSPVGRTLGEQVRIEVVDSLADEDL